MKQVSGTIKLDLAQFRELEAFSQFGSDLDAATQKLLDKGQKLTELLKQNQYSPLPFEEQAVSIYVGVKDYLKDVSTSDITRFEEEFLRVMRDKNQKLLDEIRDEKKITDKIETNLKKVIEDFLKKFK